MSEVSVMVYYTIPFKNIVTDPVLYIERLIEGANEVFRNNELPIRLIQFCIQELDVEESDRRLELFLYAKGNLTAKEESGDDDMLAAESILSTADIAILMTATTIDRTYYVPGGMKLRQNGGATFGGPAPIKRTPPLGWVAAGSDQGDEDPVQTFTHEVGHIFGWGVI